MNVEEWLRHQARGVSAVPGPPDGKDRIVAAVRAYRRRRAGATLLAGAVTAAVVLGITLGLPRASEEVLAPASGPEASESDAPRPDSSAAPWINEPGTSYQPPPAPPITGRACGGRDLEARVGGGGAALGSAIQTIKLINASDSRCVLRGAPPMTAIAQTGAQPVKRGRFGQQPLALGAGAEALLVLSARADCASAAGDIANQMNLQLVEGEPPREAHGIELPVNCGRPSLVAFEPREPEPAPRSDDPLSFLEATWKGPDAAPAGSTMEYVVTLTNPTGADISLDRCPSYTQFAHKSEETLLLNCAAVPTIKAGEAESFAVRLALPRSPEPSVIKISWQLEVADGTFTGAEISVK